MENKASESSSLLTEGKKNIKIVVIRSFNFTAKAIHLGMWLWAKFRGIPVQKCYNHTEIVWLDNVTNTWMTSGAIAEGIKTRQWEPYINHFKKVEWIEYPVELTAAQWRDTERYLLTAENTPYEFENFWWHLIKIITGKWKGSTTTRQSYCYEHTLRALKASRKFYKWFNNKTLDLFMNPYEFVAAAEDKSIFPNKFLYQNILTKY